MNASKQRLSYLFKSYYEKTATPAERDELFALVELGADDEELSELMRQCWEQLSEAAPLVAPAKSEAMLADILSRQDENQSVDKKIKTLNFWKNLLVAAVILCFATIGAYQLLRSRKLAKPSYTAKTIPIPRHDALPGGNKAILTLANGKTIVLDNAQNGTLAKQGNTVVNKTNNGRLVYNATNSADANSPVTINTIVTPRGGQYQVVLPDGTQAWLNSASSLRFPTRFTGNLRQVEITGEAYFEVTKNAAMPFKVKTDRAEVEVLGTHFNIMAYSDETLMKTTLLEGAVNVTSGGTISRLKPGQQAQINGAGKTRVVDDVDVDDETAWKNGIFQFSDAGVDVILRQASRWYDLDIVYQGKLPDREFTGRIARNVKASELLKMLKYTGINLKIEGKNIVVF